MFVWQNDVVLLNSTTMFTFMLHLQLFYIETCMPSYIYCLTHSSVQFTFVQDPHCTRDNNCTKLGRILIHSITFGIPLIVYFISVVPMHEGILIIMVNKAGGMHKPKECTIHNF